MTSEHQEPRVIAGTPPTPVDPSPSNQIVVEYPDGSCTITTSATTPEVLREYEEVLTIHPRDAGLRWNYGLALADAGATEPAIRELRQAVEIEPGATSIRGLLAAFLRESGALEDAITEYQAALALFEGRAENKADQGEAILRWGLANALLEKGDSAQAKEQLTTAVTIQREAVKQHEGSPQLLGQLERLLESQTA